MISPDTYQFLSLPCFDLELRGLVLAAVDSLDADPLQFLRRTAHELLLLISSAFMSSSNLRVFSLFPTDSDTKAAIEWSVETAQTYRPYRVFVWAVSMLLRLGIHELGVGMLECGDWHVHSELLGGARMRQPTKPTRPPQPSLLDLH